MRRLTNKQAADRDHLGQALANAEAAANLALAAYNGKIADLHLEMADRAAALWDATQAAQARFEDVAGQAVDFAEGIEEAATEYAEERSEAWQEGDTGQAHEMWRARWAEVEAPGMPEAIDLPEPLDSADIEYPMAESFLAIPTAPSE